jgi:hypothetical protein
MSRGKTMAKRIVLYEDALRVTPRALPALRRLGGPATKASQGLCLRGTGRQFATHGDQGYNCHGPHRLCREEAR